jgi:hypothetical protein
VGLRLPSGQWRFGVDVQRVAEANPVGLLLRSVKREDVGEHVTGRRPSRGAERVSELDLGFASKWWLL